MLRELLLILLPAIVTSLGEHDQFVFEVSFICRHPEKYHYKIQFIEWDWWLFNGDDIITQKRDGDGLPGTFNLTQVGWLNGDELTSEGYDVRMRLKHGCTKDQKDVDVYMYVKPHCEIGKGQCHYRISQDITDLEGETTNNANLVYD